jgi:hypothetical protein
MMETSRAQENQGPWQYRHGDGAGTATNAEGRRGDGNHISLEQFSNSTTVLDQHWWV